MSDGRGKNQGRPGARCQNEVVRAAHPLSLPLFAVASLALHVAVFGVLEARSRAKAAFDPASQTLSGKTLDVEPPAAPPIDIDDTSRETPAPTTESSPAPPTTATATAQLDAPGVAVRAASSAAPSGSGAHAAIFGAVGVRFATDLATTFTRAFPQAASADPIWGNADFGSAGTADVTMVIDEDGHVTSHAIAGSPSDALRKGIDRTLALLGPRTFTARAATTRLRVTARVSRNDVHDGLHGDVFALSGGSFSGDVGTAFFALPAGNGGARRVDVELKLLP
jgi:hypothetical protein